MKNYYYILNKESATDLLLLSAQGLSITKVERDETSDCVKFNFSGPDDIPSDEDGRLLTYVK